MSTSDRATEECSRCGRSVQVSEAAMLVQEHNKALWRIVCSDCLKEIGVPRGYRLERDLSHLYAGDESGSTESPPTQAGDNGDSAVIADFSANVVTGDMPDGELTAGRVEMNDQTLVLVTDDQRTAVPLAGIQDLGSGEGSASTREFFDDVLRISYRRSGEPGVAFIAGSRETLDRFAQILYRALLSGTAVRYKHPANVGGQPRDAAEQTGRIAIRDTTAGIVGPEEPLEIRQDAVVDLIQTSPEWCRSDAGVLRVTTDDGGSAVVSELEVPSGRALNLLGRFLHAECGRRAATAADLDLDIPALRTLVWLYMHPGGAQRPDSQDSPGRALIGDSDVQTVFETLLEQDLVSERDGAYSVTRLGMVTVFDRFEDVL